MACLSWKTVRSDFCVALTYIFRIMRLGFAVLIVVLYALFCILLYIALDERSLINVIRHVILFSGVVPLLLWLAWLLVPSSSGLKLLLLSIIVTMFHYVVAVISAHNDGAAYWSVQIFEVATLWHLLRILKV